MKTKKLPNRFALANYSLPDMYGSWLGYEVVKINRKNGTARLGLSLQDKHLSAAGKIHGGVISGFFDFACGASVFLTMGPQDYCSTVELKVNYFSPLFSGDELYCDSRIVFRGKRLAVSHALLYRKGQKKPVAMATGTFNIVSKLMNKP